MATNLYEVLELESTASPEEVRKAYRRLALQTHPDRQNTDLMQAQKDAAAEQFRLVNNAYEVLSDPVKRQEYDTHGVWPPTEVPPPRSYPRQPRASTMPTFGFDPFDSDPFGFFPRQQRSRGFNNSMPGFTDPFSLFNDIFGDMNGRSMGGMFSASPFEDDDFFGRSSGRDVFNPFASGMMGMGMGMGMGGFGGPSRRGSNVRRYASRSLQSPGSGWVRESHMTRTINGVTETIWSREDNGGNEHVTYTYPDGHERYTINGADQAQPSNNGYQQPQVIQPTSPPPAYPAVQQDVRMASPPDNYPAYNQYQPPPPPPPQQQRGPPVVPPPGPPPTGPHAPAAERSRSGSHRRARSHKTPPSAVHEHHVHHEHAADRAEGSRHRPGRTGTTAPPISHERDSGQEQSRHKRWHL